MDLTRNQRAVSLLFQIIAAVVLLQTVVFKLAGAEMPVKMFTALGLEPWGRIGSGMIELIATILLLISHTAARGALLSLGFISGALLSHFTVLGIDLSGIGMNDNGELFTTALVVFFSSAIVIYIRRRELRLPDLRAHLKEKAAV